MQLSLPGSRKELKNAGELILIVFMERFVTRIGKTL
jgi:hypothetical protein